MFQWIAWYCMVQYGIAWYRCLISIMHFCLIDWTMSYSWKGLWLWMVGWVSVNSSERAASPLLAPLSVVSCLPPPAPRCCRRPCVPLLAPSFSYLLPLAWQWSPTRAPGGRRWRRRWGSSQGGCAVGSRTMLWLLRRYSQNQEWFKKASCLQANKRKQAASTNQKRLDLFTPGVVQAFGHQENFQNLTYYQSIWMDGDNINDADVLN